MLLVLVHASDVSRELRFRNNKEFCISEKDREQRDEVDHLLGLYREKRLFQTIFQTQLEMARISRTSTNGATTSMKPFLSGLAMTRAMVRPAC